jgi:hypothetical protein
VRAAAVRVNAETQSKVGRRQVGETDRFKQVFSLDLPKPGRPRLRLMPDDKSKTYASLDRGLRPSPKVATPHRVTPVAIIPRLT